MIRVSVLYPARADGKFDHDYYRDVHLPLVQARMGSACLSYQIDKGIPGAGPDGAPPFVAICHIFSDSVEAFAAGVAPHAAEISADMANYTDITPLTQFSEVVAL